jgi:hypothetical protein
MISDTTIPNGTLNKKEKIVHGEWYGFVSSHFIEERRKEVDWPVNAMQNCSIKITPTANAHPAYCLYNATKLCGTFGSIVYRYTKVEIVARHGDVVENSGINTYFQTSLDQDENAVTDLKWENRYHNINPGGWHHKVESYFTRVRFRYNNVWAGILPIANTLSQFNEVTRYKNQYTRMVPYKNSTGECLTFYLRSSRESIDDTYSTATYFGLFANVGGYFTALGLLLTTCLVISLMLVTLIKKIGALCWKNLCGGRLNGRVAPLSEDEAAADKERNVARL